MGIRRGPKSIVTEGLVFYVDSNNPSSYTSGSLTTSNLVGPGSGSLQSGVGIGDNNSWRFDGVDDNIQTSVSPSTYSITDYSTGMAYGVWFKTSVTNSTDFTFITSNANTNMTSGTGIFIRNSKCYAFIRAWNYSQTTSQDVNDGEWHYAVISKQFYFDGQVVTTGYNTTPPYDINKNVSSNLTVDFRIARNPGRANLPGDISLFHVYNRNLSSSEVLQNYNALKGRFGL